MNAQSAILDGSTWRSGEHLQWLFLLVGFAAMYVPTYLSASKDIWQSEEFGHGPVILVICGWLFWRCRHAVRDTEPQPALLAGSLLLVLGLSSYALGRVMVISSIELGSQVLVVVAALLLLKGSAAVRAAWFAVLYLLFMIPLPAFVIDAITGPLKLWISSIVVDTLFLVGYPIAREGVILTVGPYQLLMADACSGLNSLLSLSALGVLYMYIVRRKIVAHNVLLAISIVPIAVIANIVRVVLLVLITYHLGDEAGRGFLHGAAGIVLMLVAVAAVFVVDWMVGVCFKRCATQRVAP